MNRQLGALEWALCPAVVALAFLAGTAGAAEVSAARPPHLDRTLLAARIGALAKGAAPARLGVSVLLPVSGEQWSFGGNEWFPMQSVFKAPLAAMLLDAVDKGRVRFDSTMVIRERDLSPPYSAIGDSFPARTRYTVSELLEGAVGRSDNIAADVLLGLVGGPRALTAWLVAHKVDGIHVNRAERELQPALVGLGKFRSEWAHQAAFSKAVSMVPESARRAAMKRYLSGTEDMLTPDGGVAFLEALQDGRFCSAVLTARLLRIMTETPTGAHRVKAGLPPGATLTHKTGSGQTILGVNIACNDIGLVTLGDGRRFTIAVLLSGSTASEGARDSVQAAVAQAVVEALR